MVYNDLWLSSLSPEEIERFVAMCKDAGCLSEKAVYNCILNKYFASRFMQGHRYSIQTLKTLAKRVWGILFSRDKQRITQERKKKEDALKKLSLAATEGVSVSEADSFGKGDDGDDYGS